MSTTTLTKAKDALLEAGLFSEADVEALSAKLNEPGWLKAKRQEAWSIFEEDANANHL